MAATRTAPPATRVPPALVGVAFVLALAGLVAAGYLTYEHLTGSTTLACPDTGRINCAKVTESSYSSVGGAPVAILGLLYFVVLAVVMSPPAWHRQEPAVRLGRSLLVIGGLGFALYLVWVELFRLDAICLWCTSVHVIVFLLFVTTLFAEAARTPA